MSETYRAMVLPRFGAANLAAEERMVPTPEPGEIVIRLRAASVNYRDVVVIDGSYNPNLPLPLVPLSDGCGEVVACGAGVSRFRPGDRAMPVYTRGWTNGPATEEQRKTRTLGGPFDGVARQMIAVSEDNAVQAPATLSDREAAALPIAALTAWTVLKDGGVKPGAWVLSFGTGGVALFALQFAKAAGARVVSLTSTPEKAARLQALGADAVINYLETPDWAGPVREITGGRGIDIAVETAGATLPQTIEAMAFAGHVGVVGFLGAKAAEVDIRKLIGGTIRVQGTASGSRTSLEEACRAIDVHGIKPVLDETRLPIDRLAEALDRQASRGHIGKIVLDIP
ncbi:MAG: NAD(P)-dependent alcohol dehydrogenase [Pseudomonadota bacterium]